ncbi:MAG: universal stress protein [Thermomicrobiales bacterium]
MFKKIIVPLDGSAMSERALTKAKELSTALHAPLVLVRVVDTASIIRLSGVGTGVGMDYGMVPEILSEEQDDSKTYLETVIKQIQTEGLDVSGEVKQGQTAPAIVDSATAEDVIVIASHGRTGVQRWFLGSVAEDVIRRAHCPVLLIREHPEDKHVEKS